MAGAPGTVLGAGRKRPRSTTEKNWCSAVQAGSRLRALRQRGGVVAHLVDDWQLRAVVARGTQAQAHREPQRCRTGPSRAAGAADTHATERHSEGARDGRGCRPVYHYSAALVAYHTTRRHCAHRFQNELVHRHHGCPAPPRWASPLPVQLMALGDGELPTLPKPTRTHLVSTAFPNLPGPH